MIQQINSINQLIKNNSKIVNITLFDVFRLNRIRIIPVKQKAC